MKHQVDAEATPKKTDELLESALLARLDQIFGQLRDADIPFAVLRNRDRIPSGLTDRSDVDLVVPSDVSAKQLITLFSGLGPVQVIPTRNAAVSFFFPVRSIFLLLDVTHRDPDWRGAAYLTLQEILADRWDDRGIPVSSRLHQAFLAWFPKLLWDGFFAQRYVPLIDHAIRTFPNEFRALMQRACGQQLTNELWQLAEQGKLPESTMLASRCRRALWFRSLRRYPATTLRGLIDQLMTEFLLRWHPPGLDVALIGPDGAGKTTVCSLIASAPRVDLPFNQVEHRIVFERRVLPRLSQVQSKLLRRPVSPPGNAGDPHGNPTYAPLVAAMKYSYFALERWLIEMVWDRRTLARNTLLLRDRHMLEIAVDPKRFRLRGPMWLARAIARMNPQPDLVILLDAPADVLQARKQEVPFEETRRQRDAYRTRVERLPNGRIIDATQPLEQVIAEVKEAIVTSVAARTADRFALTSRGSRNSEAGGMTAAWRAIRYERTDAAD